tara:strand:- start:2889 stop:3740 length:852 start_codon:yes stop_codon:yes gene_type:complete
MSGQVIDTDYPGGVSNEDIKQQAIARAAATSNFDFPTEIVDLPSKGLLYPKDNPLSTGKVEMKYMTAREEDILTNPSLIKQGKALDKLFQALIVGNGDGKPVKYTDLTLGDKNAVMIAARVLGYGPEYEILVNIPGTKESFKHVVDLTEIANTEIDDSLYNNSNSFEFILPIGKQKIQFKILSSVEEILIAEQLEKQSLRGHSKGITTRLKHQILSIDGNTDKTFIDSFIDNQLIARDSLQLRNYITNITPDIDLTVNVVNQEYNYNGKILLPIGIDFFWPGA